jgi:CHAD domain-containing protein
MSFRIRRKETVEHAIARIAGEQVDRAIAETGRRMDGSAAVHNARKRCKRLRALLRLVRPQLGEVYAVENAWYRDAARELAHLRDAEIVVRSFDALVEHFDKPVDRPALRPVRRHLAQARGDAADARELRARLREFRSRMEAARTRIDSWSLADAGFAAIERGLTKTYASARERMRAAYESPSTEAIHEWRKRVKDHAHHLELLRAVWKRPMRAHADEVDRLADLLGDDHDLTVLRAVLLSAPDGIADPETLQAVIGLIGRRQVELRARAETIGARVFADKPKAFARRIERYWSAWRNEPATVAQLGYRPELISV